jgi:murein L,D-transpeptidase YafK
MLWSSLAGPAAAGDIWLRVDTYAASLSVMDGDRAVATFDDISVGRGGVSMERRLGDDRTPLGEFRIVKVRERSQFHRFFLIDYPNEQRARAALDKGEIDEATFRAIRRATRAGRLPPQNTPLGGNLGIHGLGRGDPRFHEVFNWTNGCIALTNNQINQLTPWIRVGTRVVID